MFVFIIADISQLINYLNKRKSQSDMTTSTPFFTDFTDTSTESTTSYSTSTSKNWWTTTSWQRPLILIEPKTFITTTTSPTTTSDSTVTPAALVDTENPPNPFTNGFRFLRFNFKNPFDQAFNRRKDFVPKRRSRYLQLLSKIYNNDA